ncbi:MAG: arylsulfatase, partial [Bacteroidales bacterium]|nr:arylsulfatase [Bacteroidales bacterium]
MLIQGSIKKLIVLIAILGTSVLTIAQQNPQKPNIVFILADDFGYGSLNSYGTDKTLLRTPHIDRIADEGMRFTNASTPASICTPTRYGFLTGRYPWRTGLKYGVTHIFSELLPDTESVTIADWLKERGYFTAAIGKWHLGYGQLDNESNSDIHTRSLEPLDYAKKVSPGPLDLGFDYHFGVPQNHDDALGVFIENDHIYGIRSNKIHPYSRSFYGQRYIGFDAPQRVNEDVMEVLTDKSVEWLKKQTKDDPFFLYFAAVAVHHPSTPSGYMRGMSDCGPYGDFIQDLDLSVGRIIETLEYMNLLENTIIIFSSDNGGDIPAIERHPEAPENQAIRYGLKINGDLRGDKHTIYEGGTNVPFIVSWPGTVKEGSLSEDMINLLDIFATVCEITDGNLPESKDVAPDSYSFLPSLLNKSNPHPRTSMVTADANGMRALRDGNWKYIDDTPPDGL